MKRCLQLAILLAAGTTLPMYVAARPFSVYDDIELTQFGDPDNGEAEAVTYSPDGRYVAVYTQRGRVDLDRPESTITLYRVGDLTNTARNDGRRPTPTWSVSAATYREGPIIKYICWLADSSGIAYLQ